MSESGYHGRRMEGPVNVLNRHAKGIPRRCVGSFTLLYSSTNCIKGLDSIKNEMLKKVGKLNLESSSPWSPLVPPHPSTNSVLPRMTDPS